MWSSSHRCPPMPPPPSCPWTWQASRCCRGRSADWPGWRCVPAAPCGETHSLGPCAPSGVSSDLNNCKTHRGFGQGTGKSSQELPSGTPHQNQTKTSYLAAKTENPTPLQSASTDTMIPCSAPSNPSTCITTFKQATSCLNVVMFL